jgi:peptidyl-prolyl cis-trans isomerase D
MLNALRDNAKTGFLKYILLGLLVMAGGGLVLMDVGGFFRGGSFGSNDVAKGGGIKISASEFDRTVRRVLTSQGIGAQEAYRLGMINQILASEIQQRLLTREAASLGIQVSDDDVMTQVEKLSASIAAGGGQSKADALRQILRQQGISEAEFIESIRAETGNTLLRGALLSGATSVPAAWVDDLYRYERQTRRVEAVILSTETVTGITQPTDDNLQKFYDANKTDFAIPETRDFTLAILNAEMIKKNVAVTDADIQKAYEENLARYTKPERRQVEQVVVADAAQAEKIAALAKEGKPLKDAVQTVTGDTKAYLGVDAYQQSGLLPQIASAVFAAQPGEATEAIQSELGWHVMKFVKLLPSETVPLESVKAELKDTLMQTKLMDDLLNTANAIDDRLAGGEALAGVVSEFGLTTQKIFSVRLTGFTEKGDEPLKSFEDDKKKILQTAFEFSAGESAPIAELSDGRFVIVHVDAVTPAASKPFADVRDTLRKRWVKEQKELANRARVMDAMKKVEDKSATLADIAKANGGRMETFPALKRTADAPKSLGAVAMAKSFTAPKGQPFMAETDGGILIAMVTNVTLADPAKAEKADRESLTRQEKNSFANDVIGAFVNDLGRHSEVKINQRLLDMMYAERGDN